MLQKLNERIQGVVAWIIIVLVTITFTLFGIDYYMQSHHDSTTLVEVNDEAITKQAFDLNFRRTRQLRDPALMTEASENRLKQQVLDEMIVNTVSMQAAHKNGFEVDSAQTNAAIFSIPQFQTDGHFSTDRYAQALNNAFFTHDSFQQEVRQGMVLNQQRFALIGTSFALPDELNQFVRLYMQTRDYDFLQIPALRFLKQANVPEQEISDYYQQHKNIFLTPEKLSIDYVLLSLQDIKNQINVSPEQLKHYYDENQSSYFTPAEWKVAHITFPIPSNATLSDWEKQQQLAEQFSKLVSANPKLFDEELKKRAADKASAPTVGVLPPIVAGQSDLDKLLVNLNKPGQISAPIKTTQGYDIFKIMAYKPAVAKPFTAVEREIKDQMTNDLAQTKYAQSLEQLSDLSYQTPDSLQPVAKALKLQVQQSELFSRHGGESTISKNQQVIHAAFSHDVLKFGNNSEPIQLDNDSVIVLRVNKHIPTAEKTLVDVKLLITEKLAKKKAQAEAKQFGQKLIKDNQLGKTTHTLVESHPLKWQQVKQATRDTDSAPSAVNELAFSLAKPGAKAGRNLTGGDYVVVELKKINDGKLDPNDKEQVASITQQIEANYGLMDYDLYISSLMKKAKIKRNPS